MTEPTAPTNAPADAPIAQPGSAAPFQTDTAGMAPSQAAAARFIDLNRAALVGRTADFVLVRQARQAREHAFEGGPVPEFIAKAAAASDQANAPADGAAQPAMREVNDRDITGLEADLAPVSDAQVERLISRAVVVDGLPRESATEVLTVLRQAEVPEMVAKTLLQRARKHREDGYWGRELSDMERSDLRSASIEILGGPEKAAREISLAAKYIESIGGKALLASVEKLAGSVAYDPKAILAFSFLARAKGLK